MFAVKLQVGDELFSSAPDPIAAVDVAPT